MDPEALSTAIKKRTLYDLNFPNGPPVPEHKDATFSHKVWGYWPRIITLAFQNYRFSYISAFCLE